MHGRRALDSDCILSLDHGETLKKKGDLTMVVCFLANAPSKVAEKLESFLVGRSKSFYGYGMRVCLCQLSVL